jgi:hypothetical protein
MAVYATVRLRHHEKERKVKMKGRVCIGVVWVVLAGLILISGVSLTREASAADPVTLTLYDPTGAFQVSQTFAPRLEDLNGKTICEVTDDSWETDRTFPAIRQLLQKMYPTLKVVTFDRFPFLSTGTDVPGLEDAVKKEGCQGAIVGNAG